MSNSRDPLELTPHWHLDCRIESELPEDNVVGTRFLINVLSSAVAFGALLFAGWLGYADFSKRREIRDWERRIEENRAEVLDIKRMQGEFGVEAAKIDEAYKLVHPQLSVYGFLGQVGRSRPGPLLIDLIEWNDTGIFVRGNTRESYERATQLVNAYVKALGKDEKLVALFREIRNTGFDRAAATEVITFEIAFYFKPAKP
jgi:hypothetical protein